MPSTTSPPLRGLRNVLGRLDHGALRLELSLAVLVIFLEIAVLCAWALLKGLSTPADSESSAGLVFRGLVGMTVGGLTAFGLLRRRTDRQRGAFVAVSMLLGVAAAPLWKAYGVEHASNALNWVQQSSTFTLFGGLRGIGTRLTMVLGLLGATMAAGRGKHVTVDLVTRWVPARFRRGLDVASWLAAATICGVVGWGFFDFVSIDVFSADPEAPAGVKIDRVLSGLAEHAFIVSRQLQLDLASVGPILVDGVPYASWLDAERWSTWVAEAGFEQRYGADAAASLLIPEGTTRAPLVVIPGLGEPHGELARAANLVLPLGLWAIGLRMAFRALRVLVDPVGVGTEPDGLSEVGP